MQWLSRVSFSFAGVLMHVSAFLEVIVFLSEDNLLLIHSHVDVLPHELPESEFVLKYFSRTPQCRS